MKKIAVLLLACAVLQWTVIAYASNAKDELEKMRYAGRQKTDEEVIQRIKTYSTLDVETRADEIAKYLAIEEWVKIAKERKSHQAIKDSGVLNLEYEKIDVKKMDDQAIISFYKYYVEKLAPFLGPNAMPEAKFKQLPEIEMRVYYMRLFAGNLLGKEAESRNSRQNFWRSVGAMGNAMSAAGNAMQSNAAQDQQNTLQTMNQMNPQGTVTNPIHIKRDN